MTLAPHKPQAENDQVTVQLDRHRMADGTNPEGSLNGQQTP